MKARFQIFETPFLLCRMAGASLLGSTKSILPHISTIISLKSAKLWAARLKYPNSCYLFDDIESHILIFALDF